MPSMTNPSQRTLDVLIREDPEFLALSEMLYGDPSVATEYLSKREPDKDGNTQRKVAVASNALGLTAGAAAIGSTLRDDRLKEGGKIAQRFYRTGQKIPAPIAAATKKIGTRGAGRLALGAVGLQGANVIGDVIVSRTLPKPDKVNKALPKVDDLVGGILSSQGLKQGKHAKPGKKAEGLGGALHAPLEHKKATGIVLGTGYLAHRRGKKKGQQEGFQSGYYAKRDKEVVEKPMPDLEIAGTFSKFDDEKRQAFGYASVVKKDGMPVIDRQGDYIDADEMEKAAYHYVKKSRVGGDMHRRTRDEYGIDKAHHVSDLIESMVFTPEKCKAMGLPDEIAKKLDGHWWVGYQIHDEDTWEQVRKQGRTGFSIHGRGKRVDTTVDKIVGY